MGWMSIWKVNERAHVQETASNHQILDECPMMAVALASHVSGSSRYVLIGNCHIRSSQYACIAVGSDVIRAESAFYSALQVTM